ncbi:hypothetical protein [Streptomyces sp. AC512_CC834]|uniref:hypothetical protein n=1 Tax=Streptomyces sp. AC512_CC834 TaxID=2823691 RepID=UPI001C25CF34|nr:hypothetical protein [Streptomyces sp. AC512_CC834]
MDLLPVNGAALSADPRAAEAIRAVGTRHGVDYTDDAAVTALLAERRQALQATQHGTLIWLGGSTLIMGVVWPFIGPILPAFAGKDPFLVAAPAGPLLVVAVAALTLVRVRWKRELIHPVLAGYRETLGVARAHGVPLTHIPAWLEGRSSTGGGKGAAPVPTYPPVQPAAAQATPVPTTPDRDGNAPDDESPASESTPEPSAPASTPAPAVPVPPKPSKVEDYERMADVGGWHDETGWLLIFAGVIGTAWAYTDGSPIGYATVFLVPMAVFVWLAGSRQGDEKNELREEALKYVKALEAAQAAGAHVPELSPQLRALVDKD